MKKFLGFRMSVWYPLCGLAGYRRLFFAVHRGFYVTNTCLQALNSKINTWFKDRKISLSNRLPYKAFALHGRHTSLLPGERGPAVQLCEETVVRLILPLPAATLLPPLAFLSESPVYTVPTCAGWLGGTRLATCFHSQWKFPTAPPLTFSVKIVGLGVLSKH